MIKDDEVHYMVETKRKDGAWKPVVSIHGLYMPLDQALLAADMCRSGGGGREARILKVAMSFSLLETHQKRVARVEHLVEEYAFIVVHEPAQPGVRATQRAGDMLRSIVAALAPTLDVYVRNLVGDYVAALLATRNGEAGPVDWKADAPRKRMNKILELIEEKL